MTKERWEQLSFIEQMANIGAEIGRAVNSRNKNVERSQSAFWRGLQLLDLTIEDKNNHNSRLKELCRLKEMLVDYFMGENLYSSTDEGWNNYFYNFNYYFAINNQSIKKA